MKNFLYALLVLLTTNINAQLDSEVDTTSNHTNLDFEEPIDVSGSYQKKAPLSQSEKLKIMRAKLEKQNELMVKKKIETMRIKQELEMTKKIEHAFNESMKNLDSAQSTN